MIDANEQAVTRHGHVRQTLRKWREDRGKTMQRLAEEAKMSLSAIDNLENARTQPTVEIASRLAEVLDVYIEQIIWLKPVGLSRPPSKLYRQFPANVQVEMATTVFHIVHDHHRDADALKQLEDKLLSLGLYMQVIDDAKARVRQVLAEEYSRQQAKALENQIRKEIRLNPALSDLSVQGIVEVPQTIVHTDTSVAASQAWLVRLLDAHVHNLPRDVSNYEHWEEAKADIIGRGAAK